MKWLRLLPFHYLGCFCQYVTSSSSFVLCEPPTTSAISALKAIKTSCPSAQDFIPRKCDKIWFLYPVLWILHRTSIPRSFRRWQKSWFKSDNLKTNFFSEVHMVISSFTTSEETIPWRFLSESQQFPFSCAALAFSYISVKQFWRYVASCANISPFSGLACRKGFLNISARFHTRSLRRNDDIWWR